MFLKYKKKNREHADDMVQYDMKKQSQLMLHFFELLQGGLEYVELIWTHEGTHLRKLLGCTLLTILNR